jgi:hypothetical protein
LLQIFNSNVHINPLNSLENIKRYMDGRAAMGPPVMSTIVVIRKDVLPIQIGITAKKKPSISPIHI